MKVDHCLSRSVRDSAALLDATRGPLPGDLWWAPGPERSYLDEVGREPGALRIGFTTRDFRGKRAHPDCVQAVEQAAALCESLGHRVEEAIPDIDGEAFWEGFLAMWYLMPSYFLDRIWEEMGEMGAVGKKVQLLGKDMVFRLAALWTSGTLRKAPTEKITERLVKRVEKFRAAEGWLAWAQVQKASYALGEFFEHYDILLSPVLSAPPVKLGTFSLDKGEESLVEQVTNYVGYTPVFNTSGFPAMSVPLHWNEAGMPIGVHFGAGFGAEGLLFRLAGQLEQARPWADKRPGLWAGAE